MPQHYQTAARMLGVTQNTIFGPADHLLKKAGERGSGHTFYRTSVGIFQPARRTGERNSFLIHSSEVKARREPRASAAVVA